MMKKGIATLLVIGGLVAGNEAIACRGMGDCTQPCPVSAVTQGTPVTVTGQVASIGTRAEGIGIDTGSGITTVYGLGPIPYWEEQGVARPEIGEAITIEGMEVTFSDGTKKLVAMSVTTDDKTIVLRDAETGRPLWKGPRCRAGNCPSTN
ncbi:MAG: hypothetical protein K6360_07940 [Deltaproteobacteria bacterium]